MCESSKRSEKEMDNVKVYCRFRPCNVPSNIRYDESMVDDGENKYSFDGIFGKFASQQ